MLYWALDPFYRGKTDINLRGMGEKRDPIWLTNSDQLITGLTG